MQREGYFLFVPIGALHILFTTLSDTRELINGDLVL